MKIIQIKTTNSTNCFLQKLRETQILKEWTIVQAEAQTSGRGQGGNYWESEPGKNLICSILLYPDFLAIKQYFLISEITSLSIKEVLDQYTTSIAKSITIKWPNDLYVNNKKIAGILIENEFVNGKFNYSIIGIGINVNQETFNSMLTDPISMKQILGKNIDIVELLNQMVMKIRIKYKQLQQLGGCNLIAQAYNKNLYCKEGFHCYKDKNGFFYAKIHSVAEDGVICLISDSGEKRLYIFKEVCLLNF